MAQESKQYNWVEYYSLQCKAKNQQNYPFGADCNVSGSTTTNELGTVLPVPSADCPAKDKTPREFSVLTRRFYSAPPPSFDGPTGSATHSKSPPQNDEGFFNAPAQNDRAFDPTPPRQTKSNDDDSTDRKLPNYEVHVSAAAPSEAPFPRRFSRFYPPPPPKIDGPSGPATHKLGPFHPRAPPTYPALPLNIESYFEDSTATHRKPSNCESYITALAQQFGVDSPAPAPQVESHGNDLASRKPLNYKTEICQAFDETGHCSNGARCRFAHGYRDLRVILRHPQYKTMNCPAFHKDGFCSYGVRCHYIHDDDMRSAIRRTQQVTLANYAARANLDKSTLVLPSTHPVFAAMNTIYDPEKYFGYPRESLGASPSARPSYESQSNSGRGRAEPPGSNADEHLNFSADTKKQKQEDVGDKPLGSTNFDLQ